jgi:polysaccharide export outer membrane protein
MGLSLQVGDAAPGGGPAPAGAPAAAGPAPKGAAPAKEDAVLATVLEAVEKDRSSYRIGPADLLEVSVYQEKDLERKVRVSPDGVITMPLAGSVKVAGLGVVEAEQALTERLKRFLIAPQVSIFIAEYGNKQVYVLGEVAKPGSYALPTEAGLTVIEAITLAGGFSQYAAPDKTRIIRKKPGGSSNIPIDISAVTKRGDKSKDLQLEPNDVVYVPESVF